MQKYKLAIAFVFTHCTVQQNHINCGRIKSKDIMQKDFPMFYLGRIIYSEARRIKLDGTRIVSCKLTNGKKVMNHLRSNKDIRKTKRAGRAHGARAARTQGAHGVRGARGA